MRLDLYLAFVLASTVLILIPGPNVTFLVANSIAYGARRALVALAGTSSAIALQLLITVLGTSSVMLVLVVWFEWLRWVGVVYLVWLGIQQWRAPALGLADLEPRAKSARALFGQGFIVSATNPKTLLFYIAFLPQFIDPARPPLVQLIALSVTFLVLATVLDGCYTLLAGRLRELFRDRRRARLRNRLSGSLLIGAGVGLALARR